MNTCELCGFESKRAMPDGRCASWSACLRRLRSGEHLKRPVRLVLESSGRTAAAPEGEPARVAREIRRVLYIRGLCVGGCGRRYSAGRPRCEECHAHKNTPRPI